MSTVLRLLLFSLSFALSLPAAEIQMVARDSNLERFPEFTVHNTGSSADRITIESSLENPAGLIDRRATSSYVVAPGETKTFPAYEDKESLQDEIALLRTSIAEESGAPRTFSSVCGTPQPTPKRGDHFVGMNVHLERYTAEEQWKCLQMMKEAGVSAIRLEAGFKLPDAQGRYSVTGQDSNILACEAFGMSPLLALNFFPKEFYTSPEKETMAYGWAKAIGDHYKGRVYAWQYGNESNSGWAAYGDAADMAAHNEAMALGSLAADPENLPGSFGIAEALPNYLREFLRLGAGAYLKAFTLHPYCGVAESGIAKLLEDHRLIRESGGDQEIWATEVGFPYSVPGDINPTTQQLTQINGFSLDQQANQLARLYLLARAKGIERVYWYDFYGKKDGETFWLVDANFAPRPAYEALKRIGNLLRGVTALGGTEATEPVQIQLFRRSDGSVFLSAWALRDGIERDVHLPAGVYTAHDILGKTVDFDPAKPLVLGERPIVIEGLSAQTASYILPNLLVNAVDGRDWHLPLQRWSTEPGATLTVPFVAFNATGEPLSVHPTLLRTYPGWKIELPDAFEVPPGKSVARAITVTVPPDATPGVGYRLAFAGDVPGPRRSVPYEARIWVNGKFPYDAILNGVEEPPVYPMHRVIDEGVVGFGREQLTAQHATATANGDLSEWKSDEFVTLDQVGNWKLRDTDRPGRDEWHVRAALRWDEQSLHVAFVVRDDDLNTLDLVSRDWRDSDNVRLFLSTEETAKRAKKLTEKDYLLYFTPTRQFHTELPAVMAASIGGYIHQGLESKIAVASRVWEGGYLIEATIPFEALGIVPKPGMTLGCNLLADDSFHGYRRYTGMTSLKDFSYWNNPQTLGTLKLLP